MKILFVSVFGYHFFNWVNQLKESNYEIYWFDVNDSNTHVKKIDFVNQTVKWKNRWDFPGRQRLKKLSPTLTNLINKLNQRNFEDFFQYKIDEIQPDIIHSFEMFSSCLPILDVMTKRPHIKWIYTNWGSDLFFNLNNPPKLKQINSVLNRIDYLFTDCERDNIIAKSQGFNGVHLGVYPGGGGYDLKLCNTLLNNIPKEKVILVKGYQGKFGRCIEVLKALKLIKVDVKDYEIIVFGAPIEVVHFVDDQKLNKFLNVKVLGLIGRSEVMNLMARSKIYIGNSISDGMPNTLLESIIMDVFPIQSNPGGATAEIICNGKNGYLINDPENIQEIANYIRFVAKDDSFRNSAVEHNTKYIKDQLERNYITTKVLEKYKLVQNNLMV